MIITVATSNNFDEIYKCPWDIWSLVNHIECDPIFHLNSFNQQLPVTTQLAIVLYWFGHFGNASSVEQVAQWAGCSAGCVVKCTQHVIIALTGLHDEAFQVTEPMKASAKVWVASASCLEWRNGWCMCNGACGSGPPSTLQCAPTHLPRRPPFIQLKFPF